MKKTGLLYLVVIAVVMVVSVSPSLAQVSITGVGSYGISGVPSAQEGLSGLTWAGGSTYYAAEDSNRLHQLTINLNLSNGTITGSPTDNSQATLTSRTDLEGVVYIGSNQVYVSDETGATITRHNVSGGSALSSVAVPDVYTAYRTNKSLESLSRQSNGASLWTANEEALNGTTNLGTLVDDGPEATTADGTVVRLQKFDSSLNPAGQWAYVTDDIQGLSGKRGVSDVCVLPDGQLLVLEREAYWNGGLFGDTLDFRNSIYLIDTAGATDTSSTTSLNGATYTPVTKTHLWSGGFDNEMYEGLCLGPKLNLNDGTDDDYSLLMISDGDTIGLPLGDDQNVDETIYALTISGVVPEPGTMSLLVIGGLAIISGLALIGGRALIRRKKRAL